MLSTLWTLLFTTKFLSTTLRILQQMFRTGPKILVSNRLPNRIFSKIDLGCPCSFVFWVFFCFLSESIDYERKSLDFESHTWNRGVCGDIHTAKNLKWGWLQAQATQAGTYTTLISLLLTRQGLKLSHAVGGGGGSSSSRRRRRFLVLLCLNLYLSFPSDDY